MAGKRIPTTITLGAVDRISKVLDKVKRKFPQLSKAAKKASNTFKLMQKRTEKLRKSMSKLGGKMKSAGKAMSMRLSAPIALAGAGIVKMAVDFQGAMNRVGALSRTIVKGQVAPEFDLMTKKARELGETTAFSATEVAQGMGFLAQAGFKANEITAAITPTLNLAAAANLDLAATADIASNIMGGFQIEAKEMTRVADVLALTTATSNTNLEQMGDAMKDAAPLAQKFGVSLENTAALAGLLGNIGIQGTKAGTTLKAMFTKLAAPSTKAKKMMEAMGFSLADASGNIRPMNDILGDLGKNIGGLNQQDQLVVINELFGLRGIAGGADLLARAAKKGVNPIAAFTDQLNNSQGAAQDMADTLLRGAPGAFKKMNSAFESMAIAIAESGMLEFVTKIVLKLTELFVSISKTSPALLKWGTIILGLVAVVGPLIFAAGLLVQGFAMLLPVLAAIKVVGAVVLAIFTGMSLPVLAIVVGIVALIAIIVRLKNKWTEMTAAFRASGGVISGIGKALGVFFGVSSGEGKGSAGAVGAAGAVKTAAGQGGQGQAGPNGKVDISIGGLPKGSRAQADGPAIGGMNLGFQGGTL